jgi:hypothetical protein
VPRLPELALRFCWKPARLAFLVPGRPRRLTSSAADDAAWARVACFRCVALGVLSFVSCGRTNTPPAAGLPRANERGFSPVSFAAVKPAPARAVIRANVASATRPRRLVALVSLRGATLDCRSASKSGARDGGRSGQSSCARARRASSGSTRASSGLIGSSASWRRRGMIAPAPVPD